MRPAPGRLGSREGSSACHRGTDGERNQRVCRNWAKIVTLVVTCGYTVFRVSLYQLRRFELVEQLAERERHDVLMAHLLDGNGQVAGRQAGIPPSLQLHSGRVVLQPFERALFV